MSPNLACTWQPITVQNGPIQAGSPGVASQLSRIGLKRETGVPRRVHGAGLKFSMSVNAFHEKAGRSQVGSFVFSLDKVFSPAESLPLSPPFHPHSSLSDFSLGASWVFSFQPVRPPVCRPLFHLSMEVGQAINAVTGTRLWAFAFPFEERF
jgi:hypothetical protein